LVLGASSYLTQLSTMTQETIDKATDDFFAHQENIPIYFTSIQELDEFLFSMKYFSPLNAAPIKKEIDSIQTGEIAKVFVLNRELYVMNKLSTFTQYYRVDEDSFHIWFKRKITDPVNKKDVFGIIPTMGMYMTHEEFEIYKQVYDRRYKHLVFTNENNNNPQGN